MTATLGRPRDPTVDERIERAVRALMAEGGFAAVTVEAVAAHAGVARTTVYRRHPSRLALATAGLLHPPKLGPPPDTGSLAGDLEAIAAQVVRAITRPDAPAALAALMVEGGADRAVRDGFVAADRAWTAVVLQRAQRRGEAAPDVAVEDLVDLLAGPLLYRVAVLGADPDLSMIRRLAQRVARAVKPEPEENA